MAHSCTLSTVNSTITSALQTETARTEDCAPQKKNRSIHAKKRKTLPSTSAIGVSRNPASQCQTMSEMSLCILPVGVLG